MANTGSRPVARSGQNGPMTDSLSGDAVLAQIASIAESAQQAFAAAGSLDELRHADSDHLGKASALSSLKSQMGKLSHEDKKSVGQALNEARKSLEAAIAERKDAFEAAARAAKLEAERLDLSEMIVDDSVGHQHLISQTLEMLEDVFVGMGFTVAEGPEVETDWYNFEALNMPEGHSARSMWDTLYLNAGEPETILLRTHTSPVQVRTMMRQEPPIYIVAPGRAFRSDTADATHLPVFHQIEGLVIDRGITFADLQGTIEAFVKALYGPDRRTRLRPSYFPFTEPSAEFDMTTESGEWVELGGCGMVNPNVLKACGLDPEEWSGFAFGFGVERMAMQRFGMDDIREFVTNDVRFLAQF